MRNQDKTPRRPTGPVKLMTLRQATRWANAARRKGQRIVVTNGCFDLLHYGHVCYLQQARALGDRLVIGLNADVSVRQLKGPTRPLVPECQRAAVLAALECVDAVVIFRGKRANRFFAAIRPDIYVKGGDYRVETLDAGERAVLQRAGSQFRFVPFVPGFSTTGLLQKLRRA